MFEIGRICMKIAGRDAGKLCIVVDIIDDYNVLIDGQTRRRKCNIKHLELIDKVVKIKKNAPNSEVIKVLKEINIESNPKNEKNKKEKKERPKKHKKVKKTEDQKKEVKSEIATKPENKSKK